LKLATDQAAEQRRLSGLWNAADVLMNETGPSGSGARVAATVNTNRDRKDTPFLPLTQLSVVKPLCHYLNETTRRFEMASGSQAGGKWSITALEAIETSAGAEAPGNIVPINTAFQVRATFSGSGSLWNALVAAKVSYEVYFYAEGFGVAASEKDLGKKTGTLLAGNNTATIDVTGGLPEGVYQIACLVRVSPGRRSSSVIGVSVESAGSQSGLPVVPKSGSSIASSADITWAGPMCRQPVPPLCIAN
jgi:hypothetical protein